VRCSRCRLNFDDERRADYMSASEQYPGGNVQRICAVDGMLSGDIQGLGVCMLLMSVAIPQVLA
jgi:hypothetical protein